MLLHRSDRTITDGTSAQCHDCVGATQLVPDTTREEFRSLLDFSVPFPPALQGDGWWHRANELLLEQRGTFTPALAHKLVAAAPLFGTSTQPMRARAGAVEFLEQLSRLGVPTLVVSAGFEDLIRAFLLAQGFGCPASNVRICSNRWVHEPTTGALQRIDPSPPITGYNKEQTYDRNRDWFDAHAAAGRRHLLVVGDSLGDVRCTEGVPSSWTTTSVGIYNERDGRHPLENYAQTFTAVLCGNAASLGPIQDLVDGMGGGS